MGTASEELEHVEIAGLIDSSPECIALFDTEGRLRFMNRAAIMLMEVEDFEAIHNRPWRSLWPKSAHPDIDRSVQDAREGHASRFEAHARTGRGKIKSFEVMVAPVRDGEGRLTALMATARDVTGAFLARRAALARSNELARTVTMLRSASRIAQLGGWSYDCASRQVSFTSDLAELLGGQTEQAHADALERWAVEDRAPFGAALQEAATLGLPLTFEGRIATPDGAFRWVRVIGEPELDNGWCVALRGATLDVTEWRETLDRVRASEQAALKATEAMSGFLATMGHELRTPLNGVLGMAQAMRRGELSDEQRERLRLIETSGETLLVLLNDLLDLSKIEAGEVGLEDGVIDIAELVRGAEPLALLALGKPVKLTFNLADNVAGQWSGDPSRVRQILHNLISNALKFTDRGAVTVEIASEPGCLVFRIADTGVGIPEDRLAEVFDRFVQADGSKTRRHGGSGLGLAICRDLLTMMGGEIGVQSVVGGGTTFTVSLPTARVEMQAPSELAPGDDALPRGGSLRVLAAEDNEANQLVLKTLLGSFGIEPVIVANGQAAVDAWRSAPWDVILMDIQMPVMDGVAAACIIRETERREGRVRTPIIALTANAMAHQRVEYLGAEMDDVVAKPIDLMQLLQAIDKAIDPDALNVAA